MRAVLALAVVVIAAGALAGCSSGVLPGSGSAGNSTSGSGSSGSSGSGNGSAANAGNACALARTALSEFVTGSLSQPYQKDDICYFGVGSNGGKSGAALAALYSDAMHVQYDQSGADSNYQGAVDAYGGAKSLSGVGTSAMFYDGGNGDPQVFARSGNAFCLVQTFINDATVVGLSKTTEAGHNIASADVPKLTDEIGGVCNALFGK